MPTTHNAREHFQKAMEEFIGQNYENSIDGFTRAIETDPELKLAILSRGSAYFKLDRLDEACRDFDRVVEIDPNNARAYHLRGLISDKTGDHSSALADFNKAIDLDPGYGAAYYSRANLHSKMGSVDEATEDIQMATHLTEANIEKFANENNVWRSQQLRVEEMGGADPMVR
jgi:tetratricopeptide (TPR) repeat protein